MPTLAFLDDVLPLQLRERPDELDPVRVVWSGTDLGALRLAAGAERPDVLALDLELLGEDPITEARRLADAAGSQMVLILHRFAPRELLRQAARAGARPVKTPIRVAALRTHMTSVIVRSVLQDDTRPPTKPALPQPLAAASARPPAETAGLPPRRFTRPQLARLAEIQSSIECECPNHLAELLFSLQAFEDYSAACQNRDDADARIHAHLHQSTAQARAIIENALADLLVHERIVL